MIYPRIYLFCRYGTVVSLLAVSRLLLVFDYTYGALVVWWKELLTFHSLTSQTVFFRFRLSCARLVRTVRISKSTCLLYFLPQRLTRTLKRTQATLQSSAAIPDHYSSPLEASYRALRLVLRRQLKMKKQKNKKTEQKPNVIDGNYI